MNKTDLEVIYLTNVIIACAILHNLLLGQTTDDVEHFLGVEQAEGWQEDYDGEEATAAVEDGFQPVKVG